MLFTSPSRSLPKLTPLQPQNLRLSPSPGLVLLTGSSLMVGLSIFMASTQREWVSGKSPTRVQSLTLVDTSRPAVSPDSISPSNGSYAARNSQSQRNRLAIPSPLHDLPCGMIAGDLRRTAKPLPETPKSVSADQTQSPTVPSPAHGLDEPATTVIHSDCDPLPPSSRRRSSIVDEDVGDISLFAQALSGLEDQSFAPYETSAPSTPSGNNQTHVQLTQETSSDATSSPWQEYVQSPYTAFVPLQEYYQPSPATRSSRRPPPSTWPRPAPQLPARSHSVTYGTHSSRSPQHRHLSWLPSPSHNMPTQTGTHYPLPPVDLPCEPHDFDEGAEGDEPASEPIQPLDNTQLFAEAIQGMPPMGVQAISAFEDQAEANRGSNDELPNYAQSQREAALRSRREALSRAAELERRWAASRQD